MAELWVHCLQPEALRFKRHSSPYSLALFASDETTLKLWKTLLKTTGMSSRFTLNLFKGRVVFGRLTPTF
jgi:hypothetical protein